MSTNEPNREIDRMRYLAQQNDYNARDMDQHYPIGSPEDATSEFARNQAEINQLMVKTFTAINGKLETLTDDMQEVKSQQNELMSQQNEIKSQQETLSDQFARMVHRQDVMSNDIAQVKGGHARAEVMREAGVIALDMGLDYLRTVDKLELAKLAQANSNRGIASSDLRSFREADLVVEASNCQDTVYITVEISFTANRRDLDRAQRNAQFLRDFTGRPAHAAIASVKNDNYVTEQIDQGIVHWHSIERRSLEPE